MKLKAKILILLVMLCLCFTAVSAQPVTIVGEVLNTDIVAYINNYAIPSFAVNGTTVIVAEDLQKYGFNVLWDSEARTLNITRSQTTTVTPIKFYENIEPSGSKYCDIYSTDIAVYADGQKITSYAMNGYTMIPIEELTMLGQVMWVPETRCIKMWVDGLHISQIQWNPTPVPKTILYSPNGSHVSVYPKDVNKYLQQGWYKTQQEAAEVNKIAKSRQALSKFYVGAPVWKTFIVINKYGVVTAIDSSSGKVKVRWQTIKDGKGNAYEGFEGMIYGLGNEEWVYANELMLR